ncbi:MAG TPA: LuxR C-terminal-related transcriptional regulator [Actinomycetota bacterium]
MAAHLPRRVLTAPATTGVSHQLMSTAGALGDLATALSIEWDGIDDDARIALVRKIQQLALHLGHLAERSGRPSLEPTDRQSGSPWFDGLSFLTPREHEILRALALGASTGRIGERFGIRPATVRSHVKSLLVKLGVHSRIEAVSVFLKWDSRQEPPV